ncbi:putative membrane protein [Bacillus fengqiuensis]|nr:putative membrane protein [Bacillus fengqiuensis]
MDSQIQQLNELTDEVAKNMLQSIIDKKRKLDQINEKEKQIRWLLLGCLALISLYVFFSFQQLSLITYRAVFSFVLSSVSHLAMILIVFSLYYYLLQIRKKSEKTEKEFHDLRCEVIQKSPNLWGDAEKWEARQHVFSMMKKEYDVNLYYENK